MGHLKHTLLHLTLLLLLHQALLKDCELVYFGTLLSCSHLSTFPNGSSYQRIDTLDFENNNFIELTPYIFKNHNFYDVRRIIIRQNNISEIHPYAFADMQSVKELDLYGNNLTYLRENIFTGLKRVQYLDVGHNKLVLIEEGTFKQLQTLETLDLSYNNIRFVSPYLLEQTNASELYLSGNDLVITDDTPILESITLSVLTLQSCKLKTLYKNLFMHLPNLVYLDISDNEIKIIPGVLFKPLKYLEQLDISSNLITNLNTNMFPAPSKIQVLLCDENPLKVDIDCENIIEQLTAESLVTNKKEFVYPVNDTSTEPLQLSGNTIVELDLLNRNPLLDAEGTTSKLYNRLTKTRANEPPSDKESKLQELDIYFYIICGLSGYVSILLIVFIIEIIYILKTGIDEPVSVIENHC